MGGGTFLNRPSTEAYAVVDLQSLKLDSVRRSGNSLLVGATVTLQNFCAIPDLQPGLVQAAELEATCNLRQLATLAGAVVTANGRSSLTTALLALDASMEILSKSGDLVEHAQVELGNLLPLRKQILAGRLITRIKIPLNARLAYEYVARTPVDLPILSVAVARWPSGRTRLAVGGFGATPCMAMDGPELAGAETAAQAVCQEAGDEWASAEYRSAAVTFLVQRGLNSLEANVNKPD